MASMMTAIKAGMKLPWTLQDESWQLLYRTTYTSDNEPATTVLIPHNAQAAKLVLYAEYQDSNGLKCMPSYSYRAGAQADFAETMNIATVLVFLQEGYVVTIPDKQGCRNAFAAGHVEGRHTLDGIRATLSFGPLNFSKDTRVAGWGYSGGGIQSGWAASLKKTYAPELNMVGWYAGGTPSNLTNLIMKVNKNFFSGFLISGLNGIGLAYPSVNRTLEMIGTDKLKESVNDADRLCLLEMQVKYPYLDLLSTDYTSVGEHLLEMEPVKSVLSRQVMGAYEEETPDTPMLMAHGVGDEIAPYDSFLAMGESGDSYTRFFIEDYKGYLLYHLPKTDREWFLWEVDWIDRESEKETILFKDGDTYWSVDQFGHMYLIEYLVMFFVDKSIDEMEMRNKHNLFIRKGADLESDWYSTPPKPNPNNPWIKPKTEWECLVIWSLVYALIVKIQNIVYLYQIHLANDRDSEKEEILFQDVDCYWLLDWKGNLDIDALVKFFIDKSIDEKELLKF
ncbi:hypothetical protein MEQU1_003516 [Malassezia equina]|uniref:triacylglycerol lipase n=1 Tax=Malassezia equina TaxID=1381935 RepID=A0AAF0ELC0_9BASI|nr:hypothetical protein MEQU1_003516 [Malassezia equina]